MINLACGVIRISNKCSCFEIFDQQESFKLDMIDLACGVIQISNKCSCLEIFVNLNLIPLVVIPYLIILKCYTKFKKNKIIKFGQLNSKLRFLEI